MQGTQRILALKCLDYFLGRRWKLQEEGLHLCLNFLRAAGVDVHKVQARGLFLLPQVSVSNCAFLLSALNYFATFSWSCCAFLGKYCSIPCVLFRHLFVSSKRILMGTSARGKKGRRALPERGNMKEEDENAKRCASSESQLLLSTSVVAASAPDSPVSLSTPFAARYDCRE